MSQQPQKLVNEGLAETSVNHEVRMPALLPGDTAGRIACWYVSEGQTISPGDVIADIATERATMEVEAEDAGRIVKILFEAGDDAVEAGTPIAIIAAKGSSSLAASAQTLRLTPDVSNTELEDDVEIDQQLRPKVPVEHVDADVSVPVSDLTDETETPVKNITVRVALREALIEEMERDENVFVMGEGVADDESTYKVSYGLKARFGAQRESNMPVTEAGFSGLSIGAALAGLKPVVEFQHWSFALQAIDQIVNTAAKIRYLSAGRLCVPVVFRGPNGASSRVGAQQGQNFAA